MRPLPGGNGRKLTLYGRESTSRPRAQVQGQLGGHCTTSTSGRGLIRVGSVPPSAPALPPGILIASEITNVQLNYPSPCLYLPSSDTSIQCHMGALAVSLSAACCPIKFCTELASWLTLERSFYWKCQKRKTGN